MATSTPASTGEPFRIEAATRGTITTILVGAKGVAFRVHKEVLMQHSDYFKKALNRPWKEAEENTVRLDDIEPEIFGIFVDWIYSQKIPQETYLSDTSSKFQVPWLKACIYGDRFLAPKFSKAFRHSFIHELTCSYLLCFKAIIFGYANLSADDPLLQFMVDSHVYDVLDGYEVKEENKPLRKDLPTDFLLRVIDSLIHDVAAYKPDQLELKLPDECDYHDHISREERKE